MLDSPSNTIVLGLEAILAPGIEAAHSLNFSACVSVNSVKGEFFIPNSFSKNSFIDNGDVVTVTYESTLVEDTDANGNLVYKWVITDIVVIKMSKIDIP